MQVYKLHAHFEVSTEFTMQTENILKVSNERPEFSRVEGEYTRIKKSVFILEDMPFPFGN